MPLSSGQLLDVSPGDVLAGGLFRRCNTYRGGGGYDQFPQIAEQHFGEPGHNLQFVVQLHGCNLDCPYCYVTRAGVWGEPVTLTSKALVEAFNETDCSVFHLMGGAPALAMSSWPDLLSHLDQCGKPSWIFHSDLMLTEGLYDPNTLDLIRHRRALYAVNVKGVTEKSFLENTRKHLDRRRFWDNLALLESRQLPFYITFTNIAQAEEDLFWSEYEQLFGAPTRSLRQGRAYSIRLIEYEALPYVDEVPWGARRG